MKGSVHTALFELVRRARSEISKKGNLSLYKKTVSRHETHTKSMFAHMLMITYGLARDLAYVVVCDSQKDNRTLYATHRRNPTDEVAFLDLADPRHPSNMHISERGSNARLRYYICIKPKRHGGPYRLLASSVNGLDHGVYRESYHTSLASTNFMRGLDHHRHVHVMRGPIASRADVLRAMLHGHCSGQYFAYGLEHGIQFDKSLTWRDVAIVDY